MGNPPIIWDVKTIVSIHCFANLENSCGAISGLAGCIPQVAYNNWQTIHQKAMSEVEKPRRMERWRLYYNNLYTTLYVYIYIHITFRIVIIIIVVVVLRLVVVLLLYYCGYYYYDNHVCEWPKWQLRLRLLGSCVTWRDAIGCLDIRGYWLGFLYILYTYR